jgi:hypothetical protein
VENEEIEGLVSVQLVWICGDFLKETPVFVVSSRKTKMAVLRSIICSSFRKKTGSGNIHRMLYYDLSAEYRNVASSAIALSSWRVNK